MAGYYSTLTGKNLPTPADNSNVEGRCETGHYCPEGSGSLTACPAGTYNDARGATSATDCLKCPPGEYCNASGKTYAQLVALAGSSHGKCTAGYVCYSGSTTPTPTDNVQGIVCPVGNYCPTGTFKEIKCRTGYYSPNQQAATCLNCPVGKYCNEPGMSTTISCPQGHYCPLNSILPTPCAPGTFNTDTESTSSGACTSCPATLYCDEYGMVSSNANKRCSSGYLCTGGAYSAYPVEYSTSAANRKCPKGYFCTQGATSPSQCTAGNFQNSYAQSSCKSCPPGYYCSTDAKSSIHTTNDRCAAGYMCYAGASTSTPTDGTTGAVCEVGSYCPLGSAKGIICQDGTKTTATTQASCANCAAGKFCVASVEFACPTRRYCVAGSVRGSLCLAGTYNKDSTGLSVATQCLNCPARQYCIDGTQGSDFCESGHICQSKATVPLPTGTFGTDSNYQCPLGRYCLKAGASGTNGPTDCSASKYTYELGSDSIDDCLTCAAGTYCPTTGYTPFTCPVGKYCTRGSTAPVDCPINTYRSTTGARNERECLQCTGGYFCNTVALDSLTGKQCSTGKFCPIATTAEVNCPSGQYRSTVGAAQASDCTDCTVHYYCPEGSSARIACQAGQYCPVKSSLPQICDAGKRCSIITNSPRVLYYDACPAGYYCPQGAAAPIACAGLSTTLCPAGSKYEGGQSTSCPAGQYLSGSQCKNCDLGYVCLAGSDVSNPTDGVKGYICPAGNYCDSSVSVLEIKCPVGTYNLLTGGKALTDCLACPLGFYQSSTGQSTCFECGTGATTTQTGSTQCGCEGMFRYWKPEQNTCECINGYTDDPAIYEIFEASSEYQSLDCALLQCPAACPSGQHCDTATGTCKSCDESCTNGSGTFNTQTQICECSNFPATADAACDTACQAVAPDFYISSGNYCCDFKCTSTGDNSDKVVCKTAAQLNMLVSGGTITDGDIAAMSAGTTTTAASGNQQCPQVFFADAPACATNIYAARRNLESGDDRRDLAALATTYDQTIICLTTTVNSVTWEVSATSFPVYNKDHALNDDFNFDDAAFDTLKYKLVNGGVSLTSYTYSFSAISNQIAIAFNDYSSASKLTVIALNRASCASTVMPLNAANLKTVGIDEASFLSLTPMEAWLVVFPLFFMIVAIGFGGLVKFCEIKYEQRRIANLKKKKEFIREDGSVDRIQYLKDLYKVIKQYLDSLNDDDPLKSLLDNENNEKDRSLQSEKADDIKLIIENFFDDLRFADGDLVDDKLLGEIDSEEEGSEGDTGEGDMENSMEHSEEFQDPMDESEEDEEGHDLELEQFLGPADGVIEEQDEDAEDEKEGEAILAIKKENERKLKDYEESLKKLGLSDEEVRELLEKYEDSLRRAREMMEGDAKSQEEKRKQRLEERKRRMQEGRIKMGQLDEKVFDVNDQYREKLLALEDEISGKIVNINDDIQAEEDVQRKELDRKLKDRLKKFKDNFYAKIKGANGSNQKRLIAEHEKENERLQKDLERERAYQEKKLLKMRDARRKRLVDDKTKDIRERRDEILKEQAENLEDIEREKIMVAAEYGLEHDIYPKNKNKEEDDERHLSHVKEIELLRLKQKQRIEKEFDDVIDEHLSDEEDMDELNNDIQNEREDFKKRIAEAPNDDYKQKLLRELEEREQDWGEQVDKQRQQQEQQLFERKKRRELYKERNKFKLATKHRDQNLKKELELMEFEAYKREVEATEKIQKVMEEKRGDKDLPLLVYKMIEDMIGNRLDDQNKIQFYELSGSLANLYTNIAFDKALSRKNLEEDMNDKVKELDAKNVPSNKFKEEISQFQKELDLKGKQQEKDLIEKQMKTELELRENLKKQNYNDKKKLEEDLFKKKEDILKQLGKDFRNEDILKLLMNRSRDELDERLLKIAEERENDIQKIKFQLVAKNKKDLEMMEKKLQQELDKTKREEEIEFEKKKKRILKDLRAKHLENLKNRENYSKEYEEALLKKHEEEISRLEIALAKEKERQFRRMREKLILKKLKEEKEHRLGEAKINKELRESEMDDEGRRGRGKGKKTEKNRLLSQLTSMVVDRNTSQYNKQSIIPRKHGINLNVILRGFKDSISAKQEDQGRFDPDLYLKFKGDIDEDESRYRGDAMSVKTGATSFKGLPEIERLRRRLERVKNMSEVINKVKAQQIIEDLNRLTDLLKRK